MTSEERAIVIAMLNDGPMDLDMVYQVGNYRVAGDGTCLGFFASARVDIYLGELIIARYQWYNTKLLPKTIELLEQIGDYLNSTPTPDDQTLKKLQCHQHCLLLNIIKFCERLDTMYEIYYGYKVTGNLASKLSSITSKTRTVADEIAEQKNN